MCFSQHKTLISSHATIFSTDEKIIGLSVVKMSESPGKREPLSSKNAAQNPVVADSVQKLVVDFWKHWENLERDCPRA
jgi:hypothetical protein